MALRPRDTRDVRPRDVDSITPEVDPVDAIANNYARAREGTRIMIEQSRRASGSSGNGNGHHGEPTLGETTVIASGESHQPVAVPAPLETPGQGQPSGEGRI